MSRIEIDLKLTTQGPPYPPSEIMDPDGNFVVIGNVIQPDLTMRWTSAIVARDSPLPEFGKLLPYRVIRPLSSDELATSEMVLHTLSLPLRSADRSSPKMTGSAARVVSLRVSELRLPTPPAER